MSDRGLLLELVDDYLAGTLSGERLATLERRLRAEPDSCRRFWVALQHEILLRQYPYSGSAEQPLTVKTDSKKNAKENTTTDESTDATVSAPSAWWSRPRWALASCAALLVIAVSWALLHHGGDADVLARVAQLHAPTGDAGLLHHADQRTEPLRSDLVLRSGDRLSTALGTSLELRFTREDTVLGLGSQTTMTLSAGPEGVRVQLESGTLTAAVAHQTADRQVAITTPQATVAVIGTRFTVMTAGDRTSVEVDDGRVRITSAGTTTSQELGPGQAALAETGKPLAIARVPELRWDDRRPLGVMMLCREKAGWPNNPRGWFGDAKVDVMSPSGLAAFHRRVDALIDSTLANLREVGAQGVVFWDLEGPGYLGDPRRLATLAPEMDVVADRMMARLRAAGFAVGVVVRTESLVATPTGGWSFRPLADPVHDVQAKIAYAQKRWGATIFPLLGDGGNALTMTTICRRITAASPGVLLIPTGADADTWRWGAPWTNPAQSSTGITADTARQTLPGAFTVIAPLEGPYLTQHRDALVKSVAAGDVMTFRAWSGNPEQRAVKAIYAEAKP